MAEIRDVYTVEFDSTAFEQQIQSAIAQIEQLNASLEDSADATGGLESATSQLNSILKTEASGIDQLNAKRNVLVNTQKNLNKESESYAVIGTEISNTNKRIATTTAQTTTKSRGLFSTFLRGARSLNTVRRSVSLLNVAFRTIAGVSVFGLLLQAVPVVLSFFSRLRGATEDQIASNQRLQQSQQSIISDYVKETQELNNLFGALNEANEGRGDKSAIIDKINQQYGEYLGNIDLETAGQKELEIAYRAVAEEIARGVIERRKQAIAAESQERQLNLLLERRRLEESLVQAQQRVREETDKLNTAEGKRAATIGKTGFAQKDLNRELENARRAQNAVEESIKNLDKEISTTRADLQRLDDVTDEFAETLAASRDVDELTGSLKRTGTTAKTSSDNVKILAGSIADLKRQLSDLQQLQQQRTAATDPEALIAIEKQIDALKEQIDAAESALNDFRNQAAARERIEKLTTDLIENETDKRIETLRRAANAEIENVIGSEEQKAEQRRLINERLTRDIERLVAERTEKENDAIRKASEETRATIQAANEQLIADAEAESNRLLSVRLQAIEQRRNAELQTAANTIADAEQLNSEVESINKRFDQERVQAERETQAEILRIQIAAVQARIEVNERAGESVTEERAELEKLKLELVELGRVDPTIEIVVDDEQARQSLRETITEIADTVEQISNELLGSVSELLAIQTEALDASVQRSRDALNTIRQDSENFNARQLELEKQRLERLEAERARAAEREKAIALTQLTVNSLVAVSKAAAEGGIAAPFTIASTIIALIAGFASARSASENAFFEGTEYVDPHNKYPAGRDTVPARLHKGERVITTKTNREYWNTLSAIHNGDVPASVLNDFVSGYLRDGMTPNAMSDLSPNIVLVNTGSNSGGVEKRLERIETVLSDLPKYMPRTTIKGDMGGLLRVVEKRQARANFNNNRAK